MISVTIPTLNSSKTLAMTVNSVLDQGLNEAPEVIVVDGGSTDATLEIAQSYGAKIIPFEGRLLGARRRGLQEARGDTIVLLDSDQILRPGAIGKAAESLSD